MMFYLLKKEKLTQWIFLRCIKLRKSDVPLSVNGKVENIAWSNGDAISAYYMFGDVVYFGTTYRSITYGMFFGAWLGINNHVVFFGCALPHDETPPGHYRFNITILCDYSCNSSFRSLFLSLDTLLTSCIFVIYS